MSKPFRLKHPEPSEAAVLRAVLQALALPPRVAWAQRFNTAAGKLVRGKGHSQFMRFGFPGCPDILGQLRCGKTLAVEVKRPSGTTTPEQVAFLDCVNANGGLALVARSADDVWKALA